MSVCIDTLSRQLARLPRLGCLAILTVLPVGAAEWYVSGSGKDTNAGTSTGSAFLTLSKAAKLVNPGDTVWVMNGSYANDWPTGSVVTLSRSGTPDQWITWKAVAGHQPELRFNGWSGIDVAANYQIVEGLTITGNNDACTTAQAEADADKAEPDPRFNGNGFSNNGRSLKSHHLTIRNCVIRKCGGSGIGTVQFDYLTCEGNQVYENAWYSRYGQSGISLYQNWNFDQAPGYHMIIRRNRAWNNRSLVKYRLTNAFTDGNGIIIDDANNTQFGSTLGHYFARTLISDNICWNNGGSGVVLFESERIDFVNNTTFNNGQVVDYPEVFVNVCNEVRILNNVLIAKNGGRVNQIYNNTNVTFDYNQYWNGAAQVMGAHDSTSNPSVINASNDPAQADFRLQAGSPALDSGTTINGTTSTSDFSGTSRPQGSGIDRGAFERPVTIAPPIAQAPFGGVAKTIPGRIETGAYDIGGEGIAFHDEDTVNSGGALRSDGVDLEASSEGGTNLGWIGAGEWLEYTVNANSGLYAISFRVAAPAAGGQLTLTLDGSPLGTIAVPATGGWQQWNTITLPNTAIGSGNGRILRLTCVSGGYNLSRMDFTSVGLPTGWAATNIGAVGSAGTALLTNNVWTVTGSGDDIWNNADACNFVARSVTGDVQITAQVTGLINTDPWAKAGVMIRESLTPGARHFSTFLTPGNGACCQRRTTTNSSSLHTAGAAVTAPYWVRCERVGSTCISSTSTNGSTWVEIRRQTLSVGASVHVGLAVTSHNNGSLTTATFTNVQVVAAATASN